MSVVNFNSVTGITSIAAQTDEIRVINSNGTPGKINVGVITGVTAIQATTFYGNGIVPVGAILMWSGLVANIPTGWALCNGSNGTPDLRNRFIIGADADTTASGITSATSSVTGAATTIGGTKDAIVVEHNHTITDPGHSHSYNMSTAGGAQEDSPLDNFIYRTSSTTGSQTTGITINNTGSSGTNQNLPPYYALAFIMRTS